MANENLTININTKANTVGVEKVKMSFAKLKELGSNVSQIGIGMTALFTAPIAGIIALIAKNEKLKASFQPVIDAVKKLGDKFIQVLLPVVTKLVEQLVPKIVDFVNWIGNLITQFQGLPEPVQNAIFGFVGFLAILGPALAIVGQMIVFGANLGLVLEQLGVKAGLSAAGVWAVVAPVAALAAAIYALIKLTQMEEFKQVWAMFVGGATGIATGDRAKADAVFLKTSKDLGLLDNSADKSTGNLVRGLLNAPPSGAQTQAAPVVFNYQPVISTADMNQAIQALTPIMQQLQRQQTGRNR